MSVDRMREIAAGTGVAAELAQAILLLQPSGESGVLRDSTLHEAIEVLKAENDELRLLAHQHGREIAESEATVTELRTECKELRKAYDEERRARKVNYDAAQGALTDLAVRTNELAVSERSVELLREQRKELADLLASARRERDEALRSAIEAEGKLVEAHERARLWQGRAEWARQADLDAPWPSPPEDSDTAAERRSPPTALTFLNGSQVMAKYWIRDSDRLVIGGVLRLPDEVAEFPFDGISVGS